jgi:hypothetical protein
MKYITNERIMVECSIMKLDMPWFKFNRNKFHGQVKIYKKKIKDIKEGHKKN